jgi:hypothetical protein
MSEANFLAIFTQDLRNKVLRTVGIWMVESGQRRQSLGVVGWLIIPYAAIIGAYEFWVGSMAVLDPYALASIFLMAMLAAIFVTVGAGSRSSRTMVPFYDL